MGFKGKKEYGNYKTDTCPFCGQNAYAKNKAKIPVCLAHKDTMYPELKCACGEWLDVVTGKFGTYCKCVRCGNVKLDKAITLNKTQKQDFKIQKNETTSSKIQKIKIDTMRMSDGDKKVVLESAIEKAQKEMMRDPVKKKAETLGIKSWKDL